MRRRLVLLIFLTALAARAADYDTGAAAVGYWLQRLQTTARVLHIAAHPDDEDTALLAWLARGRGARVAYLSLNRGEGGQNSIGPELGEALGILRTEELLAARRLDGAEQYFTSVRDFGFSKTLAESRAKWGEERTLGEVVAIVRRFRPQVIVTRFAGEPSDGHGHHQLAGHLSRLAFRAAADPQAFSEQLAAGLAPWQAEALYFDRYAGGGGEVTVEVGQVLPLYGRSALEIAMESRSRHRSQDMGRIEPKGPYHLYLRRLDAAPGYRPGNDLIDAAATSLPALVPAPAPGQPVWREKVHAQLVEADELIRQAQALYTLNLYPRQTVSALAKALRALRRAADLAADAGEAAAAVAPDLEQKLDEASRALALTAGLRIDALADRATITPGESLTVVGQVWWRMTAPADAVRIQVLAPRGWAVAEEPEVPLLGNQPADFARAFRLTAPADAPPTQPYWLTLPADGERYRLASDAPAGAPFAPPLRLSVRCGFEGAVLALTVPVTWRQADPRRGERRREVAVTPAITAEASPALHLVAPGAEASVEVAVTLRNQTAAPAEGGLWWRLGERWLGDATPVTLAAGERRRVTRRVPVPAGGGTVTPRLFWLAAETATPLYARRTIDYDHVPRRDYLVPVELRCVPVTATVSPGVRVGYVPGPVPDAAEALRRLGVPLVTLDEDALDGGAPFQGLTAVLVGARAYEVNDGLRRNHGRLIAWVRAGGTLIVEYQKYPYAEGKFAPYPLSYAQPHDRVTDETAAVRLVEPDHPLLGRPNRLGPDDFEEWVQERGLYFAHTWDERYRPLLACHDPGETDRLGGLLAAEVDQGRFVYCGYALFRQLPAGVPGAFRILANLVSWGRD